ncbi:hypothetical protein HC928_18005 [bacterium]|nr:hypothetical protein [bacterium]
MSNPISLRDDSGSIKELTVDLVMEILSQQDENDFCVDFDALWQWCDYSTKGNAKRKLEQYSTEGEDYRLIRSDKSRNHQRPTEEVL